jgi:predicted O-methyltransferase YrrM
MIKRIYRKLSGSGQTTAKKPEWVAGNTFASPGNQWYLPALAGPSTFMSVVSGKKAVEACLQVMRNLNRDAYLDFVIAFYEAGLKRFDHDWIYADINTVLLGLSQMLQPESYLEIGVRCGRSMAMVVSQAPKCDVVGFDLWITDYAGMKNPGEEFVRKEIKRIGHMGSAQFVAGDSSKTIPQFFKEHPDQQYDLITVDGDHSVEGARRDILNVIEHVKVGGALVFDDTANQSHPGLSELWNEQVGGDPRFAVHTFNEVGFGVGFAIRKV